jgi:hypothetical protein
MDAFDDHETRPATLGANRFRGHKLYYRSDGGPNAQGQRSIFVGD